MPVEMKRPLYAALKAMAQWRDDGDVALALLHAQSLSANDPGWQHCTDVFLRGVARAVEASASALAVDDSPETKAEIARDLALSAQVLARLAAEFRRAAAASDPGAAPASAVEADADRGTPDRSVDRPA